MSWFLPHYWGILWLGIGFWDWHSFFFSIWKMVCHFLLPSKIPNASVLPCRYGVIPPSLLSRLPLSFILRSLTMVCLGTEFAGFTCLGFTLFLKSVCILSNLIFFYLLFLWILFQSLFLKNSEDVNLKLSVSFLHIPETLFIIPFFQLNFSLSFRLCIFFCLWSSLHLHATIEPTHWLAYFGYWIFQY